MFAQWKWILIHGIVIVMLLYSDTASATYARNAINFAGIVNNITVYAIENGSYPENDDNTFNSLKLNVSWTPPHEGRQPSSYSIVITSIPRKNYVNKIDMCTEGSVFYTMQAKSGQLSLLIPQNKLSNGMPEVQIHPNCMYKIQVYANPRAKPTGKLPEVNYTVPECVGRKCSCMRAKASLPIPKVEAIQVKRDVIIKWNIASNNSYVKSYVISVGIPLLTSKAGHSVYNITRISNVTSATNTFTWDSTIYNRYIKLEKRYKIFVAATDYRDCLGIQGDFVITIADKTETAYGNVIWPLFVGIVISAIIGFISFVLLQFIKSYYKNGYQLLRLSIITRSRRQVMPALSTCKSPDLVLQKHNILYVEQKFEEICYKAHENDELEISYKFINLMHELGKGQFGKVYLGSLNNNENISIAVKVSQSSDASNESEARRQLLEEIETMKLAGSHPHLVKLIGYCTSPDNPICILLEYMEGGDLLAYLRSRRTLEWNEISLRGYENVSRYVNIIERDKTRDEDLHGTIGKQQFMKFALDIAKGMAHLEAKGITHRDLAARNILLTSDLTLKVSDFGLSRNGIYVINKTAGKVRQLPIRWMSPEAIRDHTFSSKSDVWSYGIVLWEIGTLGSFPYPDIQDDELLHYLTQNKCHLTCPKATSQDVYNIMRSCWNTVPRDRPTFVQLVLDLRTLKEPFHSMHETSNPCYTLLSR